MKNKWNGALRALKIILGILLFLIGILILAAPVISTVLAVEIAAIALMVIGVLQLIFGCACRQREGIFAANVVTAIMNAALGALILIFNRGVIVFLPELIAIWLGVFGIMRIIEGTQLKKQSKPKWKPTIGIGIISLAGTITLIILHWVVAMDIIGILLAAFCIIYGLILLSDGLVKSSHPTKKEIREEDEKISTEENASFRRFEEKLHENDKK